jgi:SAM-dependent methyltransferase
MGWNVIGYSGVLQGDLERTIASWKSSSPFKRVLLTRENYLCTRCFANFRMRAHAKSVLRVLGLPSVNALATKLRKEPAFRIFETAATFNIFRFDGVRNLPNYLLSEYFDDKPAGGYVDGTRNENLECLTFPDESVDVVINSDVLEHVANLDEAISEIRRVLKPGGYHVFTVPADNELKRTRERAAIVNAEIIHFMEPEIHGDPIRETGSLAFRNFGTNTAEYMSRAGMECKKYDFFKRRKFVTSVYYARKSN